MSPTADWYHHRPSSGVFDEALDEHGQVRPAWAGVARRLGALGATGLAERHRRCEHLLAAHGATYVPHHELLGSTGAHGGWRLDPVPFVVGRDEWTALVDLVGERARAVAAVARDLAGPRHLVRDGVVPPAALFADPAFLPLAPAGTEAPLWWYGVDVVRTADGQWRVLRDLTDVVGGVGEALLHRSVVGRVLGDLHDRPGPSPLTGYLAEVRALLAAAAPAGARSPRTVVLTPEPGSLEYVATSYLTAQLGFHRTSAADLVVREHRVFLRSLGGLEPVDVVLRAVTAGDLDPLVNPGGGRGVPGIVHAARQGAVSIVNPIGAALAGAASVAPHLAEAARHLVGRAPRLAGVDGHWCGDPEVAAEVGASLSRWVLRDTMTGEAVFGDGLVDGPGAGSRDDWASRLRLRPTSIVALPRLRLASVPVGRVGHAEAGAVVLGLSALVHGDRVEVMPGGFARVVDPAVPIVAQRSGWAKDVWVYAPAPARAATVTATLPQVDLRTSLPTRAAEAMFWLGRSAEGAEEIARLVRTVADRLAADPTAAAGGPDSWREVAGRLLRVARGAADAGDVTLDDELHETVRGRRGLLERLDSLALAASSVREFLSTTTGRVLADIGDLRRSLAVSDPEGLERLLVSLAALSGLAQESIVRGPAWRLLDLGRRVERAVSVLSAVDAALGRPLAPEVFQAAGETVLAAHDSLVAYRRWHRTDVALEAAVDLLVRDDTNPRSAAFQLDRAAEHLASLPATVEDRLLLGDASAAILEPLAVTPLVLAARGPVLDLAERLVRQWFSDPVAPRRLSEADQ